MSLAPDHSVAAAWAKGDLESLVRQDLYRRLETLESPQGPVVTVNGRRLINFSSNDYLGLANEPTLAAAAAEALRAHGVGSGASRLTAGDTRAHRALERELAQWHGTQSAVLFGSGYAANIGAITALVGEGDVVFSDALNHASIIDGCRLSRARVVVYPHREVAALRALMAQHQGRRQLVVTDSVFSMEGDLAPLQELAQLCTERQAALMVDEAHGSGVLGDTGAGACEALGVHPDVRMGTLGKALGAFGAYVAGSSAVCELLINKARSLVFSTSLPAAVCAAALEAVRLLRADQSRRLKLQRHIDRFAAALRRPHHQGPIFSVVLGEPAQALAASQALYEAGVWVKAIRPPTVPVGTSRLRFSLSAAHTKEHIDVALEALAQLSLMPVPSGRAHAKAPAALDARAEL